MTRTAPPWKVLAFLGAVLGVSALGWAMLVGILWLAWLCRVYLVIAAVLVVVVAATTGIAHLFVYGNRRARVLAVVLTLALVAFVVWVVPQ